MFKFLSDAAPKVIALSDRFPWAIPVFGFISGLASFFLVERKQELAQVIAIMILASWCWLLMEKSVHRWIKSWFGFQLPQPLFHYAAQLVHQESLFFVIPFFFVTTAWNSGQAVYSGLLAIAAFVSLIDPIYFRWLAPKRILYFSFHGLTLFAALLTALPILFHLPTSQSYQWSLGIALLIAVSGVISESGFSWWQRTLSVIVLASALGFAGLMLRPWVPPATLWLTKVAITQSVDGNREPKNDLKSLSESELHKGLYAYTAIHAPRGLNERIYHVWQLDGKEVDRVALEINGGREGGYRAWSRKQNFPANAKGRWQIRVVTEANQLIGILRFRVGEETVEAAAASSADNSTAASQSLKEALNLVPDQSP
jgi:hypothetical protein